MLKFEITDNVWACRTNNVLEKKRLIKLYNQL